MPINIMAINAENVMAINAENVMAINAENVMAVVKASSAATSRKEMLKMISTFAVYSLSQSSNSP